MIKRILSKIFSSREKIAFSKDEMRMMVEINRRSLKQIPTWIDNNAFEKSYFKYGVPDYISSLLDQEINQEITYSDLILYYSKKLSKINYLELGVSVGKNFFQMANGFENSNLTGFDVENINPILANEFVIVDETTWKGMDDSIRKEPSSHTQFSYRSNTIQYVAGDIWDENCWSRLKGNKYNIIFSDALHTPEALLWEFEMIIKYELLADKFIIFWDDLNSGLEISFNSIADKLRVRHNIRMAEIIKINGWLGQNYPVKHDVGIISNLSL